LALGGAATITAAFTLRGEESVQGWAVAGLGTLGLALAALGHTTALLDLATLVGIVLFGGIAGAGWRPRAWKMILILGLFALFAGLIPRILAFLVVVGGGALVAGGSLTWAVARSAGFVAFLAATGAVLLGVRRPVRLPVGGLPARVYALHRALGITAVLALVVHLTALWMDSFVQFSWLQLLAAPWTSSYRPLAVTLGFLAMVTLLLTAASGALRRLLPGWRIVHALAYITFGLSVIHGLLAGSDTGSVWAITLYTGALAAVGATSLRRLLAPATPGKRREKVSGSSELTEQTSGPIVGRMP
ncbi:MAG TPA: ferric reductase-like transmembrane domain-containing protein, partial [Rubrobacter sp.]|nr:ferric reductase-like transmembrane domain-containing protein [Rubrobacter sp.]